MADGHGEKKQAGGDSGPGAAADPSQWASMGVSEYARAAGLVEGVERILHEAAERSLSGGGAQDSVPAVFEAAAKVADDIAAGRAK